MHDDVPVAGDADVELDPVGAKREGVLERLDRVLGRERCAAPMSEHERTRCAKEQVPHGTPSLVRI